MRVPSKVEVCCFAALAGFLAMLTLASCDSALEESPPSSLSPENYYRNAGDAETALTGAYSLLQSGYTPHSAYPSGRLYFRVTEVPSAQMSTSSNPSGGWGAFENWNWTATSDPFGNIWFRAYEAIAGANAVIGNVPSIDMDEAQKARIVGEAHFLRALQYFMLVRLFGGVPLRTQEVSGLDSLNLERASTDETYDLIIQDLTQAAEDLPLASATDYGRATKGSAQTLLAKAYLQRGSAATCDMCGTAGVTPQSDDFQNAADLLAEVINSGEYSLVEDYGRLFQLETEANDEAIFVVRHRIDGGNGESIQNYLNPPNSGWFFGSYTSGYGELPFYRSYEEGDKRKKPSWVTEYMDNTGVLRVYDEDDPENDNFQPLGPAAEKPILRRSDIGDWAVNPLDTPILRYADVLLLYAEALNEVSGGPTGAAYDALNQVRSRAGLPDVEQGMGYDSFKDALFMERGWELTQERKAWNYGQRFFDRFTQSVKDSYALRDELPENTVPVDLSIDLPKERLFPIPQSALDQNSNLAQNPGY